MSRPDQPNVALRLFEAEYAICRLPITAAIPALPGVRGISSLTVTDREISIVCARDVAPTEAEIEIDGGWRAMYAEGPMPFELTGVVASLVGPLAAVGLSVFVISTFDGDLLLVRGDDLDQVVAVLNQNGHIINGR